MAIIVDKDGNVVNVENQPEQARAMFPNIKEDFSNEINSILDQLSIIHPAIHPGSISKTGTINPPTPTEASVYTDEIPAIPGTTVFFSLTYSQPRLMLINVVFYDEEHNFIQRDTLYQSNAAKTYSYSFYMPDGFYYCRFSYLSYNEAYLSIKTTGQRLNDVQFNGESIVKNGVAYIPSADAELIADITTSENLKTLTVDTDSEGNAFNLREAHIIVLFPASTTGTTSDIVAKSADSDSGDYYSYGRETLTGDASCVMVHDYVSHGAYFDIGLFKNANLGGTLAATQKVAYINASKSIQSFVLEQYSNSTTLIPAGTRILVYGVRV